MSSLSALHDTSRVLLRDTGYVYMLPHPALRRWISNYTLTFPGAGTISGAYTVIPHGCATLVMAFGGGKVLGTLHGPATEPARVGEHANLCELLLIVEFQPAGYYAFSGMPQRELTNARTALDTLHPALNGLLAERMEAEAEPRGLIASIDRLFLKHLKAPYCRAEFSLANEMIVRGGGAVPVQEISRTVSYSQRHLGRIFGEYAGVSVKTFSRLVRVNRAARLLQRPNVSLTRAFLDTGYYDMPHFIHDFEALCGITPQAYRDNLSDFYSEIAKF